MTQQLSNQDTANLEIIEAATGLDADAILDFASAEAETFGDTVSEELETGAEVAQELSTMDSAGDDDTVWGMTSEA
jgi:hypothetical protein